MHLTPRPTEGALIRRANRFLALVRQGGKVLSTHVPNSGRLGELLFPGNPVLLLLRPTPRRKTAHDLIMAAGPEGWVSIDSRVPNALIAEELGHGRLGPFRAYRELLREAPLEGGRVDFQLLGEGRPSCLIEVKSVTLVVEGVARFPDARTERGARHLRALAEGVSAGLRGAIIFVIQRPDACAFSPNDAADPDFGQALRAAARRGVEVYARTCRVSPQRITLDQEVPVRL